MSISIIWSAYFQSDARRQGRALQLDGQVKRLAADGEKIINAKVAEKDQTYSTTVVQEGHAAVASCECKVFDAGRMCKHIWAALMDVQYSNEEEDAKLADTLSALTVRPPKARKRAGAAGRSIASRPNEPDWLGRLSLLKPRISDEANSQEQIFPEQRLIYYVVSPKLSARYNGLVVELRQRTAIASGWSKTKPFKVSADSINDLASEQDKEIIAALIGATWVNSPLHTQPHNSEQARATYHIADSVRIKLLKQMISTQRCFVDSENKRSSQNNISTKNRPAGYVPLHWDSDQPWVLWASGKMVAGTLNVEAQLRRNDEKIAVKTPALILGGSEGVVLYNSTAAPFDDRGAFPWVAHFRNSSAAQKPIQVDQPDINKFLDRLYMLGHLPEIDFPQDIKPDHQTLKPTPLLELFSPRSSQAAKLIPNPAKHQLAGQISFYYGQNKVSAAHHGIFISPALAKTNPNESSSEPADQPGIDPVEKSEPADQTPTHPQLKTANHNLIRRDDKTERQALELIIALGFRHLPGSAHDSVVLAQNKVNEAAASLLSSGWQVMADKKTILAAGPPSLTITSGMDWFELHGTLNYETADGSSQQITLPQILAAARNGSTMITLSDGSQGLLPEQWLKDHGLLTALGQVEEDHLKFHRSQTAILDALLERKELSFVDDTFNAAREKLDNFSGIEPLLPHSHFVGTIRSYQQQGLGWMSFLRNFGVGGILADDMGLGKTIQVLAMLQARIHADTNHTDLDNGDGQKRPSIIVAPKSVVFNWLDEAEKFTPDMRVLTYTGTNRTQLRKQFDQHDVIVMSYGLLRRDIEALSKQNFDYVVLDEAQAIKNPQSQSAKAARLLQSRHRLALTGTPVENHLGDLWSIFEFLNPGILGSNARFTKLLKQAHTSSALGTPDNEDEPKPGFEDFQEDLEQSSLKTPESSEQSPMLQIASALRPFILRRSKKEVLKDLPEKTEQTIYCQMEPKQREIYDQMRTYYRSTLINQLDTKPGQNTNSNGNGIVSGSNAFMVLEALLRLRQAACHPALINQQQTDAPSAKLDTLEQMLGDVIDEGGKALIFSQFTSMLALVRQRLDAKGIGYAYLDGKTRNRKQIVEQFQSDDSLSAFLISLKAGGVGLNLTAAEYVFILDPWWNPAVEAQAIDRAHRIGQNKPVFAYRMICQDTVEQRIIDLQDRKRDLADAIVQGQGELLSNLTKADLEQLLS